MRCLYFKGCLQVAPWLSVGIFVVNIRNVRRVRANKRDAGYRPMAAATGAVEITMPVAIVAAAYIIGQGFVDAFGD